MVITTDTDIISIGTGRAGMYFQSPSTTNTGNCSVKSNEIENIGRQGYKIVFKDNQDENYSASISIRADKPGTSGPYQEPHYAWEQGIELKTHNPADRTSGALANDATLRIGYYEQAGATSANANKTASGFLGDV